MLVTTSEEERVGLEEQKGEHCSSDVSIVDRSEREFRVTRANGIRDKRGKFNHDIRTRHGSFIYIQACTYESQTVESKVVRRKRRSGKK